MVSGAPTFTEGEIGEREGFVTFVEGTGEGEPTFGSDYYQNIILWAALAGADMTAPCGRGGLVDRIVGAARGE